jgi:hypothetical protein
MLFNKANFNFCIAGALLGLSATALPLDARGESCEVPHGAKAIYFLTNGDSNSVVAIPTGINGTLSGGATIATGGKGGSTVNATGGANGPDALSSQSALTAVDDVSGFPSLHTHGCQLAYTFL